MGKKIIIGSIVLAVFIFIGWLWGILRLNPERPGVIELVSLPPSYCPKQVELVVTNPGDTSLLYDQPVSVIDCKFIELGSLPLEKESSYTAFAKLPGAIAFKLGIDSRDGNYTYSPTLGDVNNDNSIDNADQVLVETALFSTPSQARTNLVEDVDQDNSISVLDLGFTRINQKEGVARPDNKEWQGLRS